MQETESTFNLVDEAVEESPVHSYTDEFAETTLTVTEKRFLLYADRGDCASVKRLIDKYADNKELDINCKDPLNRTALVMAIENENMELIKLLLEHDVKVQDALLHAIKEEYVEAVEFLLVWEEEHHVPGEPYSWEKMDRSTSTFTSDITPLILAAHKNNYEIIKILLDRGASLPVPHDAKCGCDDCVKSSSTDSLRHSQARINAYRALTSPSLIALSSKDPILTAFELSWELRRLSHIETEFTSQYKEMRAKAQEFAASLLDYTRTSTELEVMLNYNHKDGIWQPGDRQSLDRLKLAIKYKQKLFVSHPNVQQLLGALWYEGLPGFRRKSELGQILQAVRMAAMFPIYCSVYMVAPNSKMGLFMKKPFVKFICQSASYAFFLLLLGCASQRIELLLMEWFGNDYLRSVVDERKWKERGSKPGIAECGVVIYVMGLIWGEIKALWSDGLKEYVKDLWNIVDFITNAFYLMWIATRAASWVIVAREAEEGNDPWYPREKWDAFEPMLISEGAFAAGMIFSFLKLVHIFSINPHLGPLQISLSRMIIDIVKFFFIYSLVLFAFGCGLNQLLWYYAELEKNKCYVLPGGLPDFENNDKACTIWRRYANLFETSQSLFWASFGLVDLVSFELTGIKGFTRFWALLMFGSYSVINIIVLLNMLIAMMSNSYQIISERADVEWKFARSKLWISYFDDGATLPPPFNIFPTVKSMCKCARGLEHTESFKDRSRRRTEQRFERVMRLLIRRYITAEQRMRSEFSITEDDVMEIRQDISTLRYDLIEILHKNGMKTPQVCDQDSKLCGKKGKEVERRILNDFHIGLVEGLVDQFSTKKTATDIVKKFARAFTKKGSKKTDWNLLVRKNSIAQNPIGSSQESLKKRRESLRKLIVDNVENPENIDQNKLLECNAKLSEVPASVRFAYVKFMTKKLVEEEEAISTPELELPNDQPSTSVSLAKSKLIGRVDSNERADVVTRTDAVSSQEMGQQRKPASESEPLKKKTEGRKATGFQHDWL